MAMLAAAPPPAAEPVPWWVPAPHRDAEFTRMLFAILDGSMMSRGDGWFGPAESRYSWAWLAAKHNIPPKADLPEDSFRGPPELFAVLDRNHDGVLRAEDFDWADGAPFVREMGAARRWLDRADRDNDGKLSMEEWDALFKRAAGGKDHLTPEDVRKLLYPPAPKPAARPSDAMPSKATLVLGLLSGELGSARPGPKVGDPAPDFTRKSPDGKQTVRLADFHGKKPVVLVFGSFT
jgi:hypothetical protein